MNFYACFSNAQTCLPPDPAEIIEIRQTTTNGSDTVDYEFYVHYEGFNRRLDEWIPRDAIDESQKCQAAESETKDASIIFDPLDGPNQSYRKLTRNQKRKHDEINHVQKVFILGILVEFR